MTSRLLLFFALITLGVYGQQGNIWYFGYGAGLDFNGGTPIALTDGQVLTDEGVATIADYNGDLRFYTDGMTVWNKNHNIMSNGVELMGDSSSSQSGVIIPSPASPNDYYIFTVDAQVGDNGFRYSKVDMLLEAGFGDVTSTKNVPLLYPTTEQVTAVLHQNGIDVWVITHGFGNNTFYSYLITSSGISDSPVISNTGISIGMGENSEDAIGYMKASPDGSRIAITNYLTGVQLFDFNDATGEVSNAITISNVQMQYGLEFSPSGNVLYTSSEGTSDVIQYNLLASDIGASSLLVLSEPETSGGALQLAPDGKIYKSVIGMSYLSVINSPNIIGIECNGQSAAIDLGTGMAFGGLPTFIQSYFIEGGIVAENFCLGDNTNFSIDSTAEINSVEWDFGDGETSDEFEPIHIYDSEGIYHVTATIVQEGEEQILEKNINIVLLPAANTPPNLVLCDDESADLEEEFNLADNNTAILGGQSTADHSITYHASTADADANINPLAANYTNTVNPQTICARITNASGCYDVTSFIIQVMPYLPLDMPQEIVLCPNLGKTLAAPPGFDSYLWSTGETTQTIEVSDPGLYTLTASKIIGGALCESYAEIIATPAVTPVIENLDVTQWTQQDNTITVVMENAGSFMYSLDNINFQELPVFNGLESGIYTVYIKSINGSECGTVTQEVVLFSYPKFFTPNGDSMNETWHIPLGYRDPSMMVYVYDRYGKLVSSFRGGTPGWDGTHNGKDLPATDYWFVIKRGNGEEIKGHFSLIR